MGVLAHVPNVKYGVDRGKDAASAPWYHLFHGERRNDPHMTLDQKRAARAQQRSEPYATAFFAGRRGGRATAGGSRRSAGT
jgi:hypothetical protein